MADSVLTEAERKFLLALQDLGVRFMMVGMSAALLQGARGATDDIDLWFERLDDPKIDEAARTAGGFWISGTFGMRPPAIGGEPLGDRFDVVMGMHGLGSFQSEYERARVMDLEGIEVRVLPLARIIESKRATGRARDRAQLPALEEALEALRENEKKT